MAQQSSRYVNNNIYLLYEIYKTFWCDWFTSKQVRSLIQKHDYDKGFLTRSYNQGILEQKRGKHSHKLTSYRLKQTTKDTILEIMEGSRG